MISIAVAGKNKNSTLTEFLSDRLTENFSVYCLRNGNLKFSGKGTELLLLETQKPESLPVTNSVIIIQKNSRVDLSACKSTVIISSENIPQLKSMMDLENPVITCGMSSKDTFSCTSRTKDTAVISLQRSLISLNGEEIMPFETPVMINENEDIYSALALTAFWSIIGGADNKFICK